MKGEEQQVRKEAESIGKSLGKDKKEQVNQITAKGIREAASPKEMLGISDAMVEGIYGQAYRLYNTGKYKDAAQLFRLLIMANAAESKYSLGLGACLHMLKEYQAAAEIYAICAVMDPDNPIPFYHASDCFTHLNDPGSALVSLQMALDRIREKPAYQTLKDRIQLSIDTLKKEINKPKE